MECSAVIQPSDPLLHVLSKSEGAFAPSDSCSKSGIARARNLSMVFSATYLFGAFFVFMFKKITREAKYENINSIRSKHCFGEYFVLSYGDGRPSDA